jgi:hypothetical protein
VNGQRTIHGRENESSALTLALEFTRRGAEAVSRSGGIHASTPFSAQLEALRRAAEANGWLKTFDWLPESPDARGFEHEVWFLGGRSWPCPMASLYFAGLEPHLAFPLDGYMGGVVPAFRFSLPVDRVSAFAAR